MGHWKDDKLHGREDILMKTREHLCSHLEERMI